MWKSNLGDVLNPATVSVVVNAAGGVRYAGGKFKSIGGVGANNIAKWNGTSWEALGSGVNDTVNGIAVVGSDVYVGGIFTQAGGSAVNRVARWNGSQWLAMGAGVDNSVLCVGALSTSEVYIGGQFANAGGSAAGKIARWNGTAWTPLIASGIYNGVTSGDVYVIKPINSTLIYVGGSFGSAGGDTGNGRFTRWLGTRWLSMSNSFGAVYTADIVGTEVYAGGGISTPSGNIARWTGVSWSALGTGLNDIVYGITALSATEVYAGGQFTTAGGSAATRIAKWNGAQWSSIGTVTHATVGTPLVASLANDGTNVFVGGTFTSTGTAAVSVGNALYNRTTQQWTPDSVFTNTGVNVYGLATKNNVLYVGGVFAYVGLGRGVIEAKNIAKLSGTQWLAMGVGPNNAVRAIDAVDDNNVYIGGDFTQCGGSSLSQIARWNGSQWMNMSNGVNSTVNAIYALSTTEVYVGGDFTWVGGTATANRIVKWNGTLWQPFIQPVTLTNGVNNTVTGIHAFSGSNIYAIGNFTSAGGVSSTYIARWGTQWNAVSGLGGLPTSIKALSTSEIYVGGQFTLAGGSAANRIAKWNGTIWSPLGAGLDLVVNTVSVVSSSEVYVGGTFTQAGGSAANRVAKWNGSQWEALEGGADAEVQSSALKAGMLYVGGKFSTTGPLAKISLGGWTTDSVAPTAGNSGTLTASDVTELSLTLNWTKATDNVTAQSNLLYYVYYSTNSTLNTVAQIIANGTLVVSANDINTRSITGLSAATTYYFNVIVEDEAGNPTAYTKLQQMTLDTQPPVVGGGGILTASSISATSITVNWTKATDAATIQANLQYLVYYSTSSALDSIAEIEAGTPVGSYTSDINTKVVTGLTSSTVYYFNVIVKDESNNKSAYTKLSQMSADVTSPTAGNGGALTITNVTGTSATVNWTKGTDDVNAQNTLQYLAYYSTNSNFDSILFVEAYGTPIGSYATDINVAYAIGLTSSTTYYFNVIVKDLSGNKALYSKATQLTTDVTAPIVGDRGTLVIDNVTTTSVDVKWSAATDDIDPPANLEYLVYYSTNPNLDTLEDVEANGTPVGTYSTYP